MVQSPLESCWPLPITYRSAVIVWRVVVRIFERSFPEHGSRPARDGRTDPVVVAYGRRFSSDIEDLGAT